jgi:hypothetical protein
MEIDLIRHTADIRKTIVAIISGSTKGIIPNIIIIAFLG